MKSPSKAEMCYHGKNCLSAQEAPCCCHFAATVLQL
ncbi:hypothetical protein SLEP1_g5834 [Rubroshorea leprosula]|uniref:Metallothionein n=1 Tax=Rubroshorea leprosula TaxID=152421 RepID=A0AAV5I1A6_9ROSI|nr:hypothetical protein SLEP1_g5834 [Rubroshorea leprosula]